MSVECVKHSIPKGPALSYHEVLGLAVSRETSAMGAPASVQPWDPGVGVRLRPVDAGEADFRDIVRVAPDLYIVASDRENRTDRTTKLVSDNWLLCEFRICGESVSVFEHKGQRQMQNLSLHIKTYPPGMAEAEWFPKGDRVRHVALAVCPSYLDETLELSSSALPQPLRSFASGGATDFFIQPLTMSPAMLAAAKDLLDCPFEGALKRTFAEVKAMELQCLAINALARTLSVAPPKVNLTERDIRRLHEVREFIDEQPVMPSINSIVRQFCLNRNKVSYGFKHVFGMSITAYFRERQMERALKLLEDPNLSIGEIAYRVGYAHQTNFTSAFKARFGCLPKDFRLH